jgi:hypothetical protein
LTCTLAWASPQLLRTTSSVSAIHSGFRRSIASDGKDPISPSRVSHWHSSWNLDRVRVRLAWAISLLLHTGHCRMAGYLDTGSGNRLVGNKSRVVAKALGTVSPPDAAPHWQTRSRGRSTAFAGGRSASTAPIVKPPTLNNKRATVLSHSSWSADSGKPEELSPQRTSIGI